MQAFKNHNLSETNTKTTANEYTNSNAFKTNKITMSRTVKKKPNTGSTPQVKKLLEILHRDGSKKPADWLAWSSDFNSAPKKVQEEVAGYVTGSTTAYGNVLAHSYPKMEGKFRGFTDDIHKIENDTLAPFIDQPAAKKKVEKIFAEIEESSKVLVPDQAEFFLENLRSLVDLQKKRLESYTALSFQKGIVKDFQTENKGILIDEIEKRIAMLERRKLRDETSYKEEEVEEEKKDLLKKIAKTDKELKALKNNLSRAKNKKVIQVGKTKLNTTLVLRARLKEEYDSRGSRKRKREEMEASQTTDDDQVDDEEEQPKKSWFSFPFIG